jgi:hypothetical protein
MHAWRPCAGIFDRDAPEARAGEPRLPARGPHGVHMPVSSVQACVIRQSLQLVLAYT